MKFFLFLLPLLLFANDVKETNLVNCYKIFDQRRGELEMQLEQIEAQRQAFIALKDASMNILKKKQAKVDKKLKEINTTLIQVKNIKKQNEALISKYQKILDAIKKAQTSKLVQSYSKMRAGNSAKILEDMDMNTSLAILSQLSPKILGKIFAKMDPTKAALLTEKLKSYIPKGK